MSNEEKERSHQDSYRRDDEEDYQYCRYCNCMRSFLWDRCEYCKNN